MVQIGFEGTEVPVSCERLQRRYMLRSRSHSWTEMDENYPPLLLTSFIALSIEFLVKDMLKLLELGRIVVLQFSTSIRTI